MLLADMAPRVPRVVAAETIGTRIGEGLDEGGALNDGAMERTLEALGELKSRIEERSRGTIAIATSALRRACNAKEFARRARDVTGAELRVLSGEEEAEASFRGAVGSLPDFARSHGVVDVGGGSTEYAIGTGTAPHTVRSFEIGAVRLTERFAELSGRDGAVPRRVRDNARTVARESLEPMHRMPHVDRMLFVGGSATTAVAIAAKGDRLPDAPEVERGRLQELFANLCGGSCEERKRLPGMKPQRADIMAAGVLLLDVALELAGHSLARVPPGDLLLGVLLQERDRTEGHPVSGGH